MSSIDPRTLAAECLSAHTSGESLEPPSKRDGAFSLAEAYATEAEFLRLRTAAGHKPVGLKVGFANKALWRVLKIDTLVWAHMYDDTVHMAPGESAALELLHYSALRLEPEIVVRLKARLAAGLDAAAVLQAVEWLAIGFEIIDCPFPGWEFKAADFVAAYGLHRALVVGRTMAVEASAIPLLVDRLAGFKVKLSKDGQLVEEGSGRNSLRSPALCLAELASAGAGLEPGDLISTGTLTAAHPVGRGEVWRADVEGLLPPGSAALSLRFE